MEYWLVLQSPDAASGSRAERRVVTTGYIAKTLRRCLKLRVNGTPFVTDVACHLADEAVDENVALVGAVDVVEGAWQDLVAAVDVASVDPEAVRRAVERYIDQYDGETLCSELVDVGELELGSRHLNLRGFDWFRLRDYYVPIVSRCQAIVTASSLGERYRAPISGIPTKKLPD